MKNKKSKAKKPTKDEAEKLKKIALEKKLEEERRIREAKELTDSEKDALANSIIQKADARSPEKRKSKNLENEALKIQLIGGGTTSIKEQKEIIAQFRQPYVPHFQYGKDYYKEIFRLNGWNDDEYRNFTKPRDVAIWTVRLIYGRFMKELPSIMEELNERNRYIRYCVRRYKFFQFLTPDAQKRLDDFIDECIDMMRKYKDWDSFEKDYCALHGLAYQSRLF